MAKTRRLLVEILLEEGARGGVFAGEERDLARLAVRLYNRQVRALMTPRPKTVWLDADDSPEEHRRLIAESRHSYYPVARGDLDDLLGVASIKDTLAQEIREGRPTEPRGRLLAGGRIDRRRAEGKPRLESTARRAGGGLPDRGRDGDSPPRACARGR